MKIKPVKIEVTFSESPHIRGCPSFQSMEAANAFFAAHERRGRRDRETGEQIGYYKTDFKITFEDGETYEGRFDIGSDDYNLTKHCVSFIETYSGRVKPAHLSDAKWEAFKETMSLETMVSYGEILDKYSFEG